MSNLDLERELLRLPEDAAAELAGWEFGSELRASVHQRIAREGAGATRTADGGAGVAGGRVVGAYDDTLLGRRVDLASGEVTDSGTLLGSEHIGATILALADVDSEFSPISAVLA